MQHKFGEKSQIDENIVNKSEIWFPNKRASVDILKSKFWKLAFLDMNVQGWIPSLERKLEIAAETAHADFRCFFSAEPIAGASFAKIVPESILQTCIKISNEPPSDMKSNMRRALSPFSQETVMDAMPQFKKKKKKYHILNRHIISLFCPILPRWPIAIVPPAEIDRQLQNTPRKIDRQLQLYPRQKIDKRLHANSR